MPDDRSVLQKWCPKESISLVETVSRRSSPKADCVAISPQCNINYTTVLAKELAGEGCSYNFSIGSKTPLGGPGIAHVLLHAESNDFTPCEWSFFLVVRYLSTHRLSGSLERILSPNGQ
jgi:hypothetical protein